MCPLLPRQCGACHPWPSLKYLLSAAIKAQLAYRCVLWCISVLIDAAGTFTARKLPIDSKSFWPDSLERYVQYLFGLDGRGTEK